MKKLARKIGVILCLSFILSILVASNIGQAQDSDTIMKAPPEAPKANEYCINQSDGHKDRTGIHVVLYEGLHTGSETADGEIRNCVTVVQCTLQPTTAAGQNKETLVKQCETNLLSAEAAKAKCKQSDGQGFLKAKLQNKGETVVHCTPVQVLVSWTGGAGLLQNLIGLIYKWAASIVGIIAVLMMIVNGIVISASAGDTQAVTNAKTRIMQSLAALTILFLSWMLLLTVNPNFFTREVTQDDINKSTKSALEQFKKDNTPSVGEQFDKLIPESDWKKNFDDPKLEPDKKDEDPGLEGIDPKNPFNPKIPSTKF